jgi:hypothetical protein
VIRKSASWPARLLDGLGALGGWLVGPDPGLNRLRTVVGATVTIAGAIGAEWLFVHVSGALQRPVPPAATGASEAARVAADVAPVNHAVLIFGMVLGGIIGLMAAVSVQDTSPPPRRLAVRHGRRHGPGLVVVRTRPPSAAGRGGSLRPHRDPGGRRRRGRHRSRRPAVRAALLLGGDRRCRRLPGDEQHGGADRQALSRIAGTLAGIVVGSGLVDLIGPHAAGWTILPRAASPIARASSATATTGSGTRRASAVRASWQILAAARIEGQGKERHADEPDRPHVALLSFLLFFRAA